MELLEKLERERRELVKKRKDQKERMKALETPEEKRARRLAKKAAKVKVSESQKGFTLWLYLKKKIYLAQCTELRFASFLSGGFTTMAVINPPERKLTKRTSVQYINF